jgi:hypothetical protein
MFQYWPDFLINLVAGIVGIIMVLWLERQRRPSLSMKVATPGTIDKLDLLKRNPTTFLKVEIHNKNVPRWLAWVYDGEPALSCAAWITFHRPDGTRVFDREMQGRWSESQDPPPIREIKTEQGTALQLMKAQDTVDIPPAEFSELDICNRLLGEDVCYGWNNESYLRNWRNTQWILEKGRHLARVRVKSAGREYQDVFMIVNDVPFEEFRLEPAPENYKRLVLA